MDDIQVTNDILTKLAQLDQATAKLRVATVTSTSPLTITVAGSNPYTAVRTLDGQTYATSDVVLVAQWSGQLVVLGRLVSGARWYGPFTVTASNVPAALANEVVVTYAHGLGATPSMVSFELEDGFFAGVCMVRVSRDAANVGFVVRNVHPTATATAVIRFMVRA